MEVGAGYGAGGQVGPDGFMIKWTAKFLIFFQADEARRGGAPGFDPW